jgi:D-amino-acid oxidase
MRVTILGAGVSGLTCGVRLLEDGHEVTIVARELAPQTTSAVAGAVWFPYRVAPNERTGPWAEASYRRFAALAAQKDSAPIEMVELTMLYPEPLDQEPWWLGAVPGERVRTVAAEELPEGYGDGRAVQVPCIEAPAYLDWLMDRFADVGGRFEQRAVAAFEELPGQVVVDCAGVGATALAGDAALHPVRGQVAYVKCDAPLRFMVDEEGPNALAYVLPRRDVVVLGGTAEEGDGDLTPREHATRDILERTARLQPELRGAALIGTAVGLRPARPAVRLELEETSDGRPLIHDYGHGGSGFTLSWGCADEVARTVTTVS